ncbi:MAG: rhodanese-like domain-containing protein [Acidobacteria bacterium]|nr:rhodanese-like domain-containing protein [Acidobacteriota bacterium]
MKTRSLALLALLGLSLLQASSVSDPWPQTALVEPAALAAQLKAGKSSAKIICVAFPLLYRTKHIKGAVFAGPGRNTEGIEMLKKEVAGLAKNSEILIYCGCCPMEACPNLRPAFSALRALGYTNVKVLKIPQNMENDWYKMNYPTDTRTLGTQ